MRPPFEKATFITSALDPTYFPTVKNLHGTILPEIALAGRSNVGKSSLINNLLKKPGLAKTSSTPGKTATLNFFNIDDTLCLVDLPGYGFAKASPKEKKDWNRAIDLYLKHRPTLALILLLIDARHLPTEEDLLCIQWALATQKPLLLIFTKTDKLSPREAKKQVESILHVVAPLYEGAATLHYVPYSIKDPKARIRLIHTLWDLFTKTPSSASTAKRPV